MANPVESGRRKRIVVYCQHLSGAGHYVRCREIVRALSRRHDVWFVVGGSDVPGPKLAGSVSLVQLPAIHRTAVGLAPLDSSQTLAEVFGQRRFVLDRLLGELSPDLLLIEHFPFSKWVLRDELTAAIKAAKSANSRVKVVSSVRDYPAGHEASTASAEFRNEVVPTLNAMFDLLLVHSDPRVVRLETLFPWMSQVAIPVHYTGYVSEKLADPEKGSGPQYDAAPGYVLVSSGGLRDGNRLANLCVAAWKEIDASSRAGRRMVIFTGLFAEPRQLDALQISIQGQNSIQEGAFELRRFSDGFLPWMAGADMSISQGGYNTTMNLLETRTRGILAPNRRTYDQPLRARRLAEWGVFDAITPETATAGELAELILAGLSRPRPIHEIAPDGAEQTLTLMDTL